MGSGNVFASGDNESYYSCEDLTSQPTYDTFDEEDSEIEETSILNHVKELLLNAQKHGCWKPGKGGVSKHPSRSNNALDGIPISVRFVATVAMSS